MQCVQVDIIHIIMFQQHTVVAVLKRVSYHCPHLTFSTMIIAFVISSVCSLIHIAVQIDGLYPPIRLWYVDTHYLHVVYFNDIHIITVKDIFIHLIAVDGVPEVRQNLLMIVNTSYLKSLVRISLFPMFLYAK